jgi:hypothetical protein
MPAHIKAVWLYDLWTEKRLSLKSDSRRKSEQTPNRTPFFPFTTNRLSLESDSRNKPKQTPKKAAIILRHPFSHSVSMLTHLRASLC